ncbi:MAG TPA: DUF4331 family protein [Chloroflexia bacterium]|nr:DUF4331 family protein [Chloroflexia bacterium]
MADHLDAPGLKSPGMNAKVDITDIYAFQKPGDSNKSILILNVNPLAPTLANRFDSKALYEIKVDTNGDAVEEITFRFKFSDYVHGKQRVTVRKATGADATARKNVGSVLFNAAPVSFGSTANVATHNDYKFFAGMRSDPFFFDLMGFLNNFQFTGADFFKDKNVFSIVLEVPNKELGSNPKIGIWARVLVPQGHTGNEDDRHASIQGSADEGTLLNPDYNGDHTDYSNLVQIDRMGRPAINTVFNHKKAKNLFNSLEPSEDLETFEDSFVGTLVKFGHPLSEAEAITKILLPDILTYDYSSSSGFLNGRKLTDDVIDIELSLVTNGKVTTDKVGPHTDLLSTFPYMGNPH